MINMNTEPLIIGGLLLIHQDSIHSNGCQGHMPRCLWIKILEKNEWTA